MFLIIARILQIKDLDAFFFPTKSRFSHSLCSNSHLLNLEKKQENYHVLSGFYILLCKEWPRIHRENIYRILSAFSMSCKNLVVVSTAGRYLFLLYKICCLFLHLHECITFYVDNLKDRLWSFGDIGNKVKNDVFMKKKYINTTQHFIYEHGVFLSASPTVYSVFTDWFCRRLVLGLM